jgi:hypothetical protein
MNDIHTKTRSTYDRHFGAGFADKLERSQYQLVPKQTYRVLSDQAETYQRLMLNDKFRDYVMAALLNLYDEYDHLTASLNSDN